MPTNSALYRSDSQLGCEQNGYELRLTTVSSRAPFRFAWLVQLIGVDNHCNPRHNFAPIVLCNVTNFIDARKDPAWYGYWPISIAAIQSLDRYSWNRQVLPPPCSTFINSGADLISDDIP